MEIETVTQLINSVGFPIVVCLILFWFIKTYLNRFITTLENFSNTLEKNSNSLDQLTSELKNRGHNNV